MACAASFLSWPTAIPTHQSQLRRPRTPATASALPDIAALTAAVADIATLESEGSGGGSATFAVLSGGVVAALAAVLVAADPEKRRRSQAAAVAGGSGDDKAAVRDYFNTSGFDRWRRIYSDSDDVNSVQLDIRRGHAETVAKALAMLCDSDGKLPGTTVCDAGCGTGSLAIPLALQGAVVHASDISSSMVAEAQRRASEAISGASATIVAPKFSAQDLESIAGKYHTVTCLDVLIHYPQDKAADMIKHLASLAEHRILISFAPKTWYYSLLKRVGELFPGPSKATRAYLHAEQDVEAALKDAGWVVRRRDMTATRFYFSRLLEAVPEMSKN